MVVLKKNTAILLFRYNNYKNYDLIKEHKEKLSKAGSVWVLKTGKYMPETKVKMIMESGGLMLLRAPKKSGGGYTYAHIKSVYAGTPKKDMNYPEYYNEMLMDDSLWIVDSLDGTWFEIDMLADVPSNASEHIHLLSNGKLVEDVIKTTRSAMMYVTSDSDIEI